VTELTVSQTEPPTNDDKQAITADIEATRERLGETVEELAHRLDVKAQVEAKVDETKQAVHAKVEDAKQTVAQTFSGATDAVGPQLARWKAAAPRLQEAAKQRDIQIAAGVAAATGLLGAVLVRKGR
jgi:hypothetical protein